MHGTGRKSGMDGAQILGPFIQFKVDWRGGGSNGQGLSATILQTSAKFLSKVCQGPCQLRPPSGGGGGGAAESESKLRSDSDEVSRFGRGRNQSHTLFYPPLPKR